MEKGDRVILLGQPDIVGEVISVMVQVRFPDGMRTCPLSDLGRGNASGGWRHTLRRFFNVGCTGGNSLLLLPRVTVCFLGVALLATSLSTAMASCSPMP